MTDSSIDGATDWAQLYRDHVDAVAALAADLADDELDTMVPATPRWTVRDVIAHLAGGPADIVSGRMDGATSPRWSDRHVTERIGLPVADLVDEIRRNADALVEAVEGVDRPAPIWDIAVHHADLHEALGRGEMAPPLWQPVLDGAAPYRLAEQPITVYAGDAAYGAGGPEAIVPPYELFRALFSRRSRSQIAAWAGDALDPEQVCVFGARDDDQPVP
jgi:uncharacterized protein (TIGR03083 family)